MKNAAKLIYEAKNRAGDHAVNAAVAGNHEDARAWSGIAVKLDALGREAVEVMAR